MALLAYMIRGIYVYSDYPFSMPESTLKELWDNNNKYQRFRSSISGPQGIVVCTTNGIAAHIGSEMLRKGGTAADAVIATALAQVVLAAGSYVSFAGIDETHRRFGALP